MKLLVTGADGFVAGSVVGQSSPSWTVCSLALTPVAYQRPGLTWHVFDLRDEERLRCVFKEFAPDAVIHTAAMADIDFCEANKEVAEAVNVGVTRNVASLCQEYNARMIFLSTDTVFDGKKRMYSEHDVPDPLNFYGETKVRGEQIVRGMVERHVITRLSLVMGLPVIGAGNSFLAKTIAALKEGREVGFPDEEIRTPVDVITLGRALLELACSEYTGYMHLSGMDRLTRFAMAQRIAERLGYSEERVVVKNPSAIPGRAPRPRDVSLNNSLARKTLKTPMRNLSDALDLVLVAQ
ncbi:MAG TPA: NAD(P)-dependent oxidoreductase [Candidatus Hydrogenedentes bacterium]|nr:NAD(P)-dependent oxidoreductase [Candidatus Hydrogenedentota bacterium]